MTIIIEPYLSNFCRTLEIPLINCEVNIIWIWSANFFIVFIAVPNQSAKFAISDDTYVTLCSSCSFINSRQC